MNKKLVTRLAAVMLLALGCASERKSTSQKKDVVDTTDRYVQSDTQGETAVDAARGDDLITADPDMEDTDLAGESEADIGADTDIDTGSDDAATDSAQEDILEDTGQKEDLTIPDPGAEDTDLAGESEADIGADTDIDTGSDDAATDSTQKDALEDAAVQEEDLTVPDPGVEDTGQDPGESDAIADGAIQDSQIPDEVAGVDGDTEEQTPVCKLSTDIAITINNQLLCVQQDPSNPDRPLLCNLNWGLTCDKNGHACSSATGNGKCVCKDDFACGFQCDEDRDCPNNYVCDLEEGVCVKHHFPCIQDTDAYYNANQCYKKRSYCDSENPCPENYKCSSRICVCEQTSVCGVACARDQDCPDGGYVCSVNPYSGDGVCQSPQSCLFDKQCNDTQLCEVTTSMVFKCTDAGSNGLMEVCSRGQDCASGVCYGGLCTQTCVTNADCPAGLACVLTGIDQLTKRPRTVCMPEAPECADCEENEYCAEGKCLEGCRVSADCSDDVTQRDCAYHAQRFECVDSNLCDQDKYLINGNICATYRTCWDDSVCEYTCYKYQEKIGSRTFSTRICANTCGNAKVESKEACDDGNREDGDYCSADCKQVTGFCGDGVIQDNESFDPGQTNGNWIISCDADYSMVNGLLHFGSTAEDRASAIRVDKDGDIWVAGWTLGKLTGQKYGRIDSLLARVKADGTLEGLYQFGLPQPNSRNEFQTNDMYIDQDGNIFLTGYVKEVSNQQAFVARVTRQGSVDWKIEWGPFGNDEGISITGDSQGNLYVAGRTDRPPSGNMPPGSFIMKVTSTGQKVWTKTFGGGSSAKLFLKAMDIDETNGWIYMMGARQGIIASEHISGVYIRRLTLDGTAKEFKVFKDDQSTQNNALTTMYVHGNRIYIGGATKASWGGQAAQGGYDNMVIKLEKTETDIQKKWVKQWGTSGKDVIYGLVMAQDGNLYVSGYTEGLLGKKAFGAKDIMVAKVKEDDGTLLKTIQFGSPSDDEARTMVLDQDGNILIGAMTKGGFMGTHNKGNYDIMVIKVLSQVLGD